jgi:hypothetical protein
MDSPDLAHGWPSKGAMAGFNLKRYNINVINSLTAMDGHDRPLFDKLL